MHVFEALKYVGTPISLAAFIAALVAMSRWNELRERGRLIDAAPAGERARLIQSVLVDYTPVDTDVLTTDQKYTLVQQLIEQRNTRFRESLLGAITITSLVGSLLAFFVLHPTTLHALGDHDSEMTLLENAMIADYAQSDWYDADRLADSLLVRHPENLRALSVKGTVAFYNQMYGPAVNFFLRARRVAPQNPVVLRNLADALVEAGQVERALSVYDSVTGGGPDLTLASARAYVIRGDYETALALLQGIGASVNSGEGPVLRAAALAGLATRPGAPTTAMDSAQRELAAGIAQSPAFWSDVIAGRRDDVHVPYRQIRPLLQSIPEQRIAVRGGAATVEPRGSDPVLGVRRR